MFAIQNGNKFLKVEYFIDPDKIFNVTVSARAKLYKTQAQARQDLERAKAWLEYHAQRAKEMLESSEALVAKSTKSIERLEAKLEELMLLPFREVETKIQRLRKDIVQEGSTVRTRTPTIRRHRQDLARYERILKSGLAVARVEQIISVETL